MEDDIMKLVKDKSSSLQRAIIPIIDQIALIHIRREYDKEFGFNKEEETDRLLTFLSKQLDAVLGLSDTKVG